MTSTEISFLVKKLETLIYRHDRYVKRCKALTKGLKKGIVTPETMVTAIEKLRKSSRLMEKLLTRIYNCISQMPLLDADISEQLHLLSFYIIEVYVNEEADLWNTLKEIRKEKGFELSLDIEIDNELDRIIRIRELATQINNSTSLKS